MQKEKKDGDKEPKGILLLEIVVILCNWNFIKYILNYILN